MVTGFPVSPDLSHRTVSFGLEDSAQFLGGIPDDRAVRTCREGSEEDHRLRRSAVRNLGQFRVL